MRDRIKPLPIRPAANDQRPASAAAPPPGAQFTPDDLVAAVARQRDENANNLALQRALNAALERDKVELHKDLESERQRINVMLAEIEKLRAEIAALKGGKSEAEAVPADPPAEPMTPPNGADA